MKNLDLDISLLNYLEIRNYNDDMKFYNNPLIDPSKSYFQHSSNIFNPPMFNNITKSQSNLLFQYENTNDKNPINCLKLDDLNKRLITATSTGNITVFDTSSTSLSFSKKLTTHQTSVRSMAISPYEISNRMSILLSADSGGNLIIWENGNQIKFISKLQNVHDQAITDISFSPNGSHIVTSSEDKLCKVIDMNKESSILSFKSHNSDIKTCDWARPRSLIATGGKDKKIRFFDPRQEESIGVIHDCHKDTINRLRFHYNSNFLLSGSKDHNIKLIDFRMLKVMRQFNNHDSGVNNLSWNPMFYNKFCSVGEDGFLIFCEIDNDECIKIENAHEREIFDVAYSSNACFVVTGGKDCLLKIWK